MPPARKIDLSLLTPADLARVEMEPNRRLHMTLGDRNPSWTVQTPSWPPTTTRGGNARWRPSSRCQSRARGSRLSRSRRWGSRSPGCAANAPSLSKPFCYERWQSQWIPGRGACTGCELDTTPHQASRPRVRPGLRPEDLTWWLSQRNMCRASSARLRRSLKRARPTNPWCSNVFPLSLSVEERDVSTDLAAGAAHEGGRWLRPRLVFSGCPLGDAPREPSRPVVG